VIQHNSDNQSKDKSEMEITVKQLAICYVSSTSLDVNITLIWNFINFRYKIRNFVD